MRLSMTDAKQGVPTPEQQQIELIEGSRSEPDTGEEETMRLIGPTSPLALPLKGTAYPQALREDDQHAGNSWELIILPTYIATSSTRHRCSVSLLVKGPGAGGTLQLGLVYCPFLWFSSLQQSSLATLVIAKKMTTTSNFSW